MTDTYSGDPSATPKDAVRFLVGDTDDQRFMLRDAEITWLLSNEGSDPRRAAARGAETLASKYARDIDKLFGDARLYASKRMEHFQALAKDLWASVGVQTVVPWVGGISLDDKQMREEDSERVPPFATIDMMEYPSTMPISNQEELVR